MSVFSVKMICDGTWQITEGTGSEAVYMYLFEGKERCMLLDTGYGEIPLPEIIQNISRKPLTVVLSHGHFDHIGGSFHFPEVFISESDIETYRINSEILKLDHIPVSTRVKKLPVSPDGKIVPINLGMRQISFIPVPGHTVGSICCFDSVTRNLFTADTCCKGDVLLCMRTSTSLETYSESINKLLTLESNVHETWPAHHETPLGTMIFHEYREALDIMFSGKAKLENTVCFGNEALRFKYQDIGIVIKKGAYEHGYWKNGILCR